MKEILISIDFEETRIAFLEDNKLEDFFVERNNLDVHTGNIYKGIVESIIPGMDAAFVDIGMEKRGFLYVADIIGPSIEYEDIKSSSVKKTPQKKKSIKDLLKKGQEVLVQVVKEPIGTKGPRLTTHITVPGRYIVLMPIEKHVGISKRIKGQEERERLRNILETLPIPKDMGLIFRTAALNQTKRDFIKELKYLTNFWRKIIAKGTNVKAPAIVHREELLEIRIIRDFVYEDIDKVIVDSKDVYKNIMRYIRLLMPSVGRKVVYYDEGATPLFEKRSIEKEIHRIYDKFVPLKSGGHLLIEQMESLVAIDINTGKYIGKKNLEDTALKTNMEAAEEIARQMRLRDVGGIIIVDFIDMESMEHRRQVLQTLHDKMQKDKAKFNILGMSELCLVEMTRQRVRKSLEKETFHTCPHCNGSGMVKSELTVVTDTLRKIKNYIKKSRKKSIEVAVHPDIAAQLFNQCRDMVIELEKETGVNILIRPEVKFRLGETSLK